MYSEEEYYYKADNLIRISCQSLQGIFRNRWKLLTGNEWTAESSQRFIKKEGKEIYERSRNIQKRLLREGILEDWDLSILSTILPSLETPSTSDKKKNKQEKLAIQNLANVRNKLAHNGQKKINHAQYQEAEATVKESLQTLGINETKINKLIANAGVTSSVAALEQAKKIQIQGDDAYLDGHYNEAVKFYDDAVMVPSLLPINLGTIYEKRARCYLTMGKEEKDSSSASSSYFDQALKDIKLALDCNDSSWKAHAIIARIYKETHDIENAIVEFIRAIAIAPGQTEVKEELEVCKLLSGKMAREEHMDHRKLPITLSEYVNHYSKAAGKQLTAEQIFRAGKLGGKIVPGHDHVLRGHQYSCGWGVSQDYQEAARHYAKAKDVGNAEGIYNLAILYADGKGVQRDISYAIELLTRAANMPEKVTVCGMSVVDVGVRAAQHSLGLKYNEGIGVSQDYAKAAYWYKKSANNGMGNAANNLAILYMNGKGVKKDPKMAEMYWKRGAEYGDMNAAYSLCTYYLEEMEPSLAKLMFDTAIKLKYDRLLSIKDEINKTIAEVEKKRAEMEGDVLKFEQDHKLSTQGLTFRERSARMMLESRYFDDEDKKTTTVNQDCSEDKMNNDVTAEARKNLKPNVSKLFDGNPFSIFRTTRHCWTNDDSVGWAGQFHSFNDDELIRKAEEGSVTAQRILQAIGFHQFFLELWGNGPPFTETRGENIIIFIYLRCSIEHHIFYVTSLEMKFQLDSFLSSMFESKCIKRGDLDRKVRLCYGFHALGKDDKLIVEILKEGIRRYPDEVLYYHLLSSKYGLIENNENGLKIAIDGLTRFPNAVELLYCKAVHTRLTGGVSPSGQLATRQAYEDFLREAPEDHRKVPEAYYCIASTYTLFLLKNKEICLETKNLVVKFYELGKQAESIQLSCYLPYDSTTKLHLETMVGAISKHDRNENAIGPSGSPGTSSNCSHTTSSLSSSPFVKKLPPVNESRKLYLKDPKRIEMIKAHREGQSKMKIAQSLSTHFISNTSTPELSQKLPSKLGDLQTITIQDMDPTSDKIYEKRLLNLTLIDEPLFGMKSIHLIAMDGNKEAIRLFVYKLPQNKEAREKLGFGCRLSIINPYMRMCADWKNAIRVDEPNTIVYMVKAEKMCRYCGEENAPNKCSKCKWASYCSRDCQVADWKELDHKLICKPCSVPT